LQESPQRGGVVALARESALKTAAAGVINNEHAMLGVLKPRAMLFEVSGANQVEAAHSFSIAPETLKQLNLETAIDYLEVHVLEKNSRKAEGLMSESTNTSSRRALEAFVQHGQGLLHCVSSAALSDTHPLSSSFLFDRLQAVPRSPIKWDINSLKAIGLDVVRERIAQVSPAVRLQLFDELNKSVLDEARGSSQYSLNSLTKRIQSKLPHRITAEQINAVAASVSETLGQVDGLNVYLGSAQPPGGECCVTQCEACPSMCILFEYIKKYASTCPAKHIKARIMRPYAWHALTLESIWAVPISGQSEHEHLLEKCISSRPSIMWLTIIVRGELQGCEVCFNMFTCASGASQQSQFVSTAIETHAEKGSANLKLSKINSQACT